MFTDKSIRLSTSLSYYKLFYTLKVVTTFLI
nr:MAG TPA: hypothetical protein [Caudoviricetes sp.]